MANEDLGTLRYGIEVDTKGVDKGQEAMDGLSNTAEQTGKKVDGAGKAIKQTGKSAETAAKQVDKYGNELTEADKAAGRFVDSSGRMREANGRFVKSAELAERGAKGYSDGVKEVGVSMRDAIGYATAFAASLGAVAAISAESAKEIQNMARLSGTSVEEFQKLAFGANEAGISAEKLGDIYKDTQDKVGDFLNTGGGELKDYFENIAPRVGQTAEQFRGLSGPEALGLFQQGLEKANLSAAEQIFYLESLANDASLLTPLLADNGRGFNEAAKRLEELNAVLSETDIKNLTNVGKAFNELGTVVSVNTQKIVADNAEDIIDAIHTVSETIATATKFLNENMDTIKAAATILGSAAVAYGTYRAAVIAATAAQAAFNIAARANPIGLLVTLAGAAAGAFAAMSDETQTAADKVDELTGKTNALNFAEKELLKTKIEQRILDRQKELEIMQNQLVILQAQRDAETDIQKAGRGTGGEDALETMTRKAEEAKDEITLLNEKLEELKVININSGSGQDGGGSAFAEMSDDLQDLIDKYNPLLAEQRELLAEQEKLRKALQDAAKKDIPEITNALDAVGKKLDEVRAKINLKPDSSKPMSIFDVGADTSDDFSDVLVNNLSPKLNAELGVQAKTFGSRLSDEFGKLDWGSYGQNIGEALGQALVSGDSSGLRSALGGMLSNAVSSSVGPALTGSLTSAFGAGAAGFLGPIGGGIAGAVAEGLLSGKKEVSRSVQIVFQDGIAQAFTNIQYESMFGGSNKLVGFSDIENEMLNNTLRNATRSIEDLLEDLGRSVDDFSGTFEGADLGAAIEDFTDSYINAGFGSIEAFQELGESAEQALARVTNSINDLNNAIRGVAGGGTELAVREFIDDRANAINYMSQVDADYWKSAEAAIEDIIAGARSPVEAGLDDLVRSGDLYQQAFNEWVGLLVESGDTLFFEMANRTDSAQKVLASLRANQLPEAVSRLGEGLAVASAQFASELESLIEGGDVTSALESLTSVIATDTENYANTIDNLRDDLVGLGFAGDLTAQEFAKIYNDALDNVVTPEVLARYANAAMILEDIGDLSEQAANALKQQTSEAVDTAFAMVKKSVDNQRDLIRDRYNEQRDAARDLLDTLNEGFSDLESVANSLESAISKTVDLSSFAARAQLQSARAQIASFADLGIIPSSDEINKLLSVVTGDNAQYYATAIDYYREQGRTANDIAFLSEIADDQLSEAEQQIKAQENILEQLQVQYDADMSALDATLQAAQDQIDILDGSYVELVSINEALASLNAAISSAGSAGGGGMDIGGASNIVSYTAFGDPLTWQDILNDVPRFASGGVHTGGLAIVGEYGPEIANMPAGTHISNANSTRSMMSNDNVVKAIVDLEDRVRTMALDTKALYNVVNDTFEGGIVQTYQVGAL